MTTIKKELFGNLCDGTEIYSYTLDGGEGVSATILTYGGVLNKLLVTDKNDIKKNVVLGYDCIDHYTVKGAYYGSLVGRCCNRIKNSRFVLDGKEYILPDNDNGNQLHGGPEGFSRKVWAATENNDGSLSLYLESSDKDMGYPGNVKVTVTYSIEGRALSIHYEAETDAPTVVNLTNHAYFDITGAGSNRTMDSLLMLDCDKMTDTDDKLIPNGKILSVENTPYDFREEKPVGRDIDCDFNLLSFFGGFDTNYYKSDYNGKASPIATLTDPENGLKMTVITDLPCVQLYTTNSVDEGAPDFSDGAAHTLHCGICLETQYAPDAINSPEADCVILRPGEKYDTTTSFVFGE
ncbi:MAG: galactose mutarotase [Clostridia bacterium]|nr:galactose mutarotase [Clostridia bacterium]